MFAVFLLLFLLTAMLALVGIAGMRNNQRALDEFDASVLPEIARVLELAEKVAQLAAIAPSVADADSTSPLDNESAVLRTLLGEIRRLSVDSSQQTEVRLNAAVLLDGIDLELTHLLSLSNERRKLQALLRTQLNQLDQVGDMLFQQRQTVALHGASLQAIWATQIAAGLADQDAVLGSAEADAEALWASAVSRNEIQRLPVIATILRNLSDGPNGVFQIRRNLLRTERSITSVLQLTRSHADQLGARASNYVAELRRVATERRNSVHQTVKSSESGLTILGAIAVLTALVGALYGQKVLKQLQMMTRELTRLASGDTAHPIAATARPDEIGDLARAFQVFRATLFEKERLALGLETQGRLMQTIFQSMNDGLSVYDADGKLVVWNQKFAQLFPFLSDSLKSGLKFKEMHAALPEGAVWRAITGGTVARPATEPVRIAPSAELHLPNGQVLEFRSHPMPDGGWVTVCRDLTARLAVEAQLRQAQRMEVLGQLTGGVAHDFNNFLTAILGNLELLKPRLAASKEHAELAQRAFRAAESAAGLSRRLLAFARRQPLALEAVPVCDTLEQMRDLIEYSVGALIDVRLAAIDESLCVLADRGQLENGILNIALNSAAAMPRGGSLSISVELVAASAHIAPAGAAVVIRVADTGHGIPAGIREKIVEPFFTTKTPGQGTGLGLSIVDTFVRASNGSLRIESQDGQGATVEIWLPSCDAVSAHAESARPYSPQRWVLSVLLVEDDDIVRATAVAMLADLQVTVRAVASEAEALVSLETQGTVDLVISDIMLGSGGDGIVLFHKIAAKWPQQRVVLTSGLPMETHAERADWPPAHPFLQKPYSQKALLALLE